MGQVMFVHAHCCYCSFSQRQFAFVLTPAHCMQQCNSHANCSRLQASCLRAGKTAWRFEQSIQKPWELSVLLKCTEMRESGESRESHQYAEAAGQEPKEALQSAWLNFSKWCLLTVVSNTTFPTVLEYLPSGLGGCMSLQRGGGGAEARGEMDFAHGSPLWLRPWWRHIP